MIEGSGYGFVPLTNRSGSGSRRPKEYTDPTDPDAQRNIDLNVYLLIIDGKGFCPGGRTYIKKNWAHPAALNALPPTYPIYNGRCYASQICPTAVSVWDTGYSRHSGLLNYGQKSRYLLQENFPEKKIFAAKTLDPKNAVVMFFIKPMWMT